MTGLLCVGDIAVDVTITLADGLAIGSDTDGTITLHGGGSAANVAAWAAPGVPTRFVGAVGVDALGDFLVDELAGHGVDVQALRRADATSRAVAAIVGADGNRSLVSDLAGGVAPTLADYDAGWFTDVAWLHLTAYTYIADAGNSLFRHLTTEASLRGVAFSIDPSAAHLLQATCDRDDVLDAFSGAAVLSPSHDEAEYLAGVGDPRAAAEHLLDVAECVAVTCGPAGVEVAVRGADSFHVDAVGGDIVNTLGCGDAFAGGFIAARVNGHDIRRATEAGVATAARAAALTSAR
ncbi:MAG: carbohydrate kinase family protein [Ilumatobacter sp.]|nr:carbohydrate kinase family protein [Ilumatobacter sp.]